MADDKQASVPTKAGGPEKPPSKSASDAKDDKVETVRLIEESEAYFGVRSHVAAGALTGAPKKLSAEDAQERIESWLASEVSE